MSDDIIRQIDDAVRANLCGCGCGQQIPARGPSPDFVNEKHQQAWTARGYRASGGKIAADWYTRLTDLPPCGNATSSLRRAIDKIMGKSR